MRRRAPAPTPVVLPLRVNDLLFVNEYLKPDHSLDGTAAYRVLHPHVKYETAASQACRLLKKPQVQAELARRMASGGVTTTFIQSSLLAYKQMADDAHDYIAGASICMDAARVAGLITEKREIRQLNDEQRSSLRTFVESLLHADRLPQPVVVSDEAAKAESPN